MQTTQSRGTRSAASDTTHYDHFHFHRSSFMLPRASRARQSCVPVPNMANRLKANPSHRCTVGESSHVGVIPSALHPRDSGSYPDIGSGYCHWQKYDIQVRNAQPAAGVESLSNLTSSGIERPRWCPSQSRWGLASAEKDRSTGHQTVWRSGIPEPVPKARSRGGLACADH